MKKLLLILILIVMPLQMAWAAAAVYCQHEQDASAQHVGHHAHHHQSLKDAPEEQKDVPQLHSDCGYCHSAAQASFVTPTLPAMMPLGLIYMEPPSVSFSSHVPDGPRRPDRLLVV